MTTVLGDRPLVIFDGVCKLCDRSVAFIIKRDSNASFAFSPMQSDFAKRILQQNGFDECDLDTFVLVKNDRVYTHSAAALEIAKDLDGPWSYLRLLMIIPTPIRDLFYRIIATNRYRWFGRRDQCLVPSDNVLNRFIL